MPVFPISKDELKVQPENKLGLTLGWTQMPKHLPVRWELNIMYCIIAVLVLLLLLYMTDTCCQWLIRAPVGAGSTVFLPTSDVFIPINLHGRKSQAM